MGPGMTLHALLFTDVVDSTLLAQRLGDAGAAQVWSEHDRRARELLVRHGGREIDRADGFFLLFDDAQAAAGYALDYHRALAHISLVARAGVHVGEVTLRANHVDDVARGAKPVEVEGVAKPLAARVMGLARGGQTLLSAAACQALGRALPASAEIEAHGHYRLKGIDSPVEIFELGMRGQGAFAPPQDNDKAYRVVLRGGLWMPLREVRHNLPAERDAFVGREADFRRLGLRLDAGARLVTVVGPGGTGKSRFVCRYGWAWLGDWPGGIYFCDLSEARTPDGIFYVVASALGVPLGQDPAVQIGHAIAGRGRCLVMLDNFEQILAHAPATLGRWLDRAADAAFVVTSRERLHLRGEEVLPLEPLPVGGEAMELFALRACAQRPDFELTQANRAMVERIVSLLDGLPLAIELAAARVRVLSPAQLVERMHDRFQILAGARDAAARQATLRAAIDWSWDLLAPWEQAALAQCSVFEGGFTLEAAEGVIDLSAWPQAPSAMDAVQALVDKSLVRTWVPAGQDRYALEEPYFGMYLSIHKYAVDKLVAGGDAARTTVQARHGGYFARFGTEQALESLGVHGGLKARNALTLDLDNIVAACRRAAASGRIDAAVASLRAAWAVLEMKGPFALAAELGALVMAMPGIAGALGASAGLVAASAHWRCGRLDDAKGLFEQTLGMARSVGERKREGIVFNNLGNLCREQGRMQEAQAHFESALAIFGELGFRRGQSAARGNLGLTHWRQGRMALARAAFESSLLIDREAGDRSGEGTVLGNLGNFLAEQGQMEEARACQEQALAIHREVGNPRAEAVCLSNLGALYLTQGRLEPSQACLEQALLMARNVGSRYLETSVLASLGELHEALGDVQEAGRRYEAALLIARETGSRSWEALVLGRQANLLRDLGRDEAAASLYEVSLAMHRAAGNRREEGYVLGHSAGLWARQGRMAEADEALHAAQAMLRDVGDKAYLGIVLCARGDLERLKGDIAAAQDACAEAKVLAALIQAGPESELGRRISRLHQALELGAP